MTEHEEIWVVDRVEGDAVVLVRDDGGEAAEREPGHGGPRTEDVPSAEIGAPVREGDVLRVPLGADGRPDWRAARPDDALRNRRLERARAVLDELKGRDPGGDVEL